MNQIQSKPIVRKLSNEMCEITIKNQSVIMSNTLAVELFNELGKYLVSL